MVYGEPEGNNEIEKVTNETVTVTIPVRDYVQLLTLTQKIKDIASIVKCANYGVPFGANNNTTYIDDDDALLAIQSILSDLYR